MRARSLGAVAALGLAAGLSGCNPLAYPDCYRVQCPYPPVYQNGYAGYVPAYTPGRPAFGEPPFDDPFFDYTQRSLTIAPGAGNAQAANTALETATPWPRYSSNTKIPGNGAQMVRAVHELESGTRETESAKRSLNPSTGGGGPGIQVNVNSGGGTQAVGGQ